MSEMQHDDPMPATEGPFELRRCTGCHAHWWLTDTDRSGEGCLYVADADVPYLLALLRPLAPSIAALEVERDAMQRRAEMAEDDMLSAGRACDDLAVRVTELEAERDEAREETGLLRGLLQRARVALAELTDECTRPTCHVNAPCAPCMAALGVWTAIDAALAGSGEQQP